MGAIAATASLAATVLSAGLGVAQASQKAELQQQQAQAARDQARYQEQIAENNRQMALQAAEDTRERGRIAATRQRQTTSQEIGATRAGAAARGVVVDQGTTRQLTTQIAEAGEMDALTIRSNAEREALRQEQQAANFGREAQFRRRTAETTEAPSGALGVSASAITGGGRVASRWYEFDQEGVFD